LPRKKVNSIVEVLMVILFPSLNVFLRDIWRNAAESHVFSFGLHGFRRLKDQTCGFKKRPCRPEDGS
jgi:hypothetical protein